jgi:AGCS family alanine or glycine:cation symporter
MEAWGSNISSFWQWVAVPALVLASVVTALLLRLPTFTRLGEALRTLRTSDDKASGTTSPLVTTALAAAASLGAGAAVSGATAVSLGGAGTLAWLWIFGLLLAPLRMADTLLARTSPPGAAKGEPPGSLAGRLSADASPVVSALGLALLVALFLAALFGVAGVHGRTLADASEQLLPGSAQPIVLGVAVAAGALALFGRGRAWLGWIAGGAIVALLLVAFVACLYDPSRAAGALVRAIEDALDGASAVGAFSGALASEVVLAALLHVLPPLALGLGADGALHADARASTKATGSVALVATLTHVVVATVVGISLVATGAFTRRVEDTRSLREVRFYDAPFETVSQRLEPERAWTGYVRVIDGRPQADPLEAATERGMIDGTRFEEEDGQPGDLALRVNRGEIALLLAPDEQGSLQRQPLERLDRIRVTGNMLPRGGRLLGASMSRVGGDVAARLLLAILLVLAAVGAAALGLALARTFEPRIGAQAARALGVTPAVGLALAASGLVPGLELVGLAATGLVALVVSIAILVKSLEVSRL